ncbi:hypothetical protein J6590_090168 [Homalodisca vitripennis]|nr:hypothetical protein J6590_090168 [Homalodisca vitripennis]
MDGGSCDCRVLQRVNQYKYLGVIMQSTLKLNLQVPLSTYYNLVSAWLLEVGAEHAESLLSSRIHSEIFHNTLGTCRSRCLRTTIWSLSGCWRSALNTLSHCSHHVYTQKYSSTLREPAGPAVYVLESGLCLVVGGRR